MAKAEKKTRKVLSPKEKDDKRKAQKLKYSKTVDKYVTINESKVGKITVITQAMAMRGMGCMVRTVSDVGVSETFVPGIKIKTKSAWKTLIKDVPKIKKEPKKKNKK